MDVVKKLREWVKQTDEWMFPSTIAEIELGLDESANPFEKEIALYEFLADEIERSYILRPTFGNGEPVPGNHEDCRISHYYVYDDGSWALVPIDRYGRYCDLIEGNAWEAVVLPSQCEPVLDADGVEIHVGDTVWITRMHDTLCAGNKYKVVGFSEYGESLVQCRPYGDESGYRDIACEYLTHREPDSLEKLRDDIRKYGEEVHIDENWDAKTDEWVDRLTAIMEMGQQ